MKRQNLIGLCELRRPVLDLLHQADKVPMMGVDTDPTIGRSFGFKRGLDEHITLYREILKDFHGRSEEIIEAIRPKSPTLPNTDSEPSASKSDMQEFDD